MCALILEWSFDPVVVTSLMLGGIWYCAGLWRIRRRKASGRIVTGHQMAGFAAGMIVLVIALLSPVDTVGEQLFSGHMIQHLLLIMVAAPVMAWSRPALVLVWALPRAARKGTGRAWTGALRRVMHGLMNPVLVWLLFTGCFVFWHFPRPYTWALDDEALHTVEHLSFFMTALMFWTLVFEPSGRRRLGYGGGLIFVATNATISGLPGALMILASRPLYPVHAAGAAAWHMTLMQDQQLAGLIMWLPGGLVYLAVICFLFVKWLGQFAEPATVSRRAAFMPTVALILVLPFLAGCKDHGAAAVANRTGDPEHGAALIRQLGCGSCHVVPGIDAANGVVGPPLIQVGRRVYIAGVLRNTPNNMVRWLRDPQKIVPNNAMPDMGINQPDAKDIAAYLYTLR